MYAKTLRFTSNFPFFVEKDVKKDRLQPPQVLPFQRATEEIPVEIFPGVDQRRTTLRKTKVQTN